MDLLWFFFQNGNLLTAFYISLFHPAGSSKDFEFFDVINKFVSHYIVNGGWFDSLFLDYFFQKIFKYLTYISGLKMFWKICILGYLAKYSLMLM